MKKIKKRYVFNKNDVKKSMSTTFQQDDRKIFVKNIKILSKR